MLKNILIITLIFLASLFFFLSQTEKKVQEEPEVKKQIKEYNKELEDCKENASEQQSQQKEEFEKSETIKKNVFGRGFTREPDDIVLGNLDSEIVVVEYFSPTCPHCVSYHKRIYPKIEEKYINTGKIQYIVREFIGNKQDLDATILARCFNDKDAYFKFMNIILDKQDSWAYSKNYREILTNIGTMGGISPEKYAACLNDQSLIKNLIDNTKLVAKEPRFIGTPTFFINGKQFTKPYSVEELSKAIDAVSEADEQ